MRPLTVSRLAAACALAGLLLLTPARGADPKTDAHGDPLPDGALARLGTTRWRAGSSIVLSAFLPDGKSLLTVSQDYVVQVWDRDTGKEQRHFDAAGPAATDPNAARFVMLNAGANSVALSADGKVLASVGRDGGIHLWDVATGKNTAKVGDWHTAGRAQLALSGDGKILATSIYGQKTTVYDASGKELRSFGEPTAASRFNAYRSGLSPDGKTLVQSGMEFGSGAAKTSLVVSDAAAGKELRRLSDAAWGTGSIPAMMSAVSPDAKLVAVPVGAKVKLIDTATGKEARELDGGNAQGALVFAPDGKRLVMIVGRNEGLVVWEVGTGKKLHEFGKAEAPAAGAVAVGGVSWLGRYGAGLAVSPDGKVLAWGDGSALRLIDLETGKEKNASGGHAGVPREIVFARDGKTVLTGGDDGTLRRWDAATGKELGEVALPGKSYTLVVTSPDGRFVAAVEQLGTVHLIDAATGKESHAIAPARAVYGVSVAFSPDSRSVAVGSPINQTVEVHDAATGKEKQSLALPQPQQPTLPGGGIGFVGTRGAQRVFFSPDGKRLAAVAGNLVIFDLAAAHEERQIDFPQGAAVRYATFSPDGRTVAVEAHTGQIDIWELMSGQKRLALNASKAADPNGVTRGGVMIGGRVAVANPVTLAFSPDGRLLAQADGNKARLWDLYTGKEAGSFDGHRGPLAGLAFAPEGRRLATASVDTTSLIWDAEPAVKKLPALAGPLTKEKLAADWTALEGDAGAAYEAIRRLAGDPADAVPFLAERVKPEAAPDASRVTKLIADLDSDDYDVRQSAQKELEKLGELAVGPAREALKGHTSAEVRRALEDVIKGAATPTPSAERLRTARALEALEMIHTPEAVKLLKQVAAGAKDTLPTQLARAALTRLGEK